MTLIHFLKEKLINECEGDTNAFAKLVARDKHLVLTKLEGDASTRSYFRFNDSSNSIIIMKLNLSSKLAEEGFTTQSNSSTQKKLPFIDVYDYLSQFPISIPQILEYSPGAGILLLEDVGDELLQYYIHNKDAKEIEHVYKKALDSLLIFQNTTGKNKKDCVAFTRSFDVELFNWEFNHFIEYALRQASEYASHEKIEMPQEDLKKLREIFDHISKTLASDEHVFVHRDYHSRNILVHNEKLYIIDFQDALMGPVHYDLASLLRDAYIHLDENTSAHLLNYFIEKKGIANRQEFLKHFDFMVVQRNLKAIGRFYFIDRVKKNPKFLQYIPNLVENITVILKRYKELHFIDTLFTRYYEDYLK